MPLWILQNTYAPTVLTHLKIICPDPEMRIDASGRITYKQQSMSDVGARFIYRLANLNGTIGIRGEASDWYIGDSVGSRNQPLRKVAGYALADRYPSTRVVEIVYDATACGGDGFVTFDARGGIIDLAPHVLLCHELVHAEHFLTGQVPSNLELGAINGENLYRASRGLPARGSHEGGCKSTVSPGGSGPGGPGSSPSGKGVAASVCAPLLVSLPQAIGSDHALQMSAVAPSKKTYYVVITNNTTDTFTEITLFYKRRGLSGVVFLKEEQVGPQQVRSFPCGVCSELEGYVVGFFLGNDMVARIPAEGNMTPALASALNPGDQDPCQDSWTINPG